jgi:hypothetical protein
MAGSEGVLLASRSAVARALQVTDVGAGEFLVLLEGTCRTC